MNDNPRFVRRINHSRRHITYGPEPYAKDGITVFSLNVRIIIFAILYFGNLTREINHLLTLASKVLL